MTNEVNNPSSEYAVWCASAGCLPDGDGPEFTGTFAECEEYVRDYAEDYDTSVLYSLSIEAYDGDA